jgi:hypothetical protein
VAGTRRVEDEMGVTRRDVGVPALDVSDALETGEGEKKAESFILV